LTESSAKKAGGGGSWRTDSVGLTAGWFQEEISLQNLLRKQILPDAP